MTADRGRTTPTCSQRLPAVHWPASLHVLSTARSRSTRTITKALWLKASLAHEQHRYRDSLAVWKELRATLPANSPDVAIIEANIAEAAALAKVTGRLQRDSPAPVAVQVSGTVSVDKALAARVVPGATLFIYAKAVDSPGPPLAVFRTSPTSWPVSFRLDDSLAMMPARKLSDFTRVIVEARLSRSGQAMPAPGDLYVESPVLQPADRQESWTSSFHA